jgi:serine/threonine-protein kinase
MAEVFLARRPGPEGFEKLVALKRILPHLAKQPDFVAMFLDEARLAAALSHPHIVQTFDLGCEEGVYFLAMEYVCGEDVLALMRAAHEAGERVPLADVVTILAAACEALNHAHDKGIVHRDVTPGNLLVGFDGAVKLADFGIAKSQALVGRTRTTAGTLKGKVPYMSPEQARAQPLDRRSDIFSLGVVAWELLSGQRLFQRKHELDMLRAVQMCDVPPLGRVRGDLPPALAAAVAQALAARPEERWATAAELGRALTAALGPTTTTTTSATPSAAELRRTMARLFGHDAADKKLSVARAPVEKTGLLSVPGVGMSLAPLLRPERWIPQIAMHLHLPPPRARLVVPLLALLISAGGLLYGLHSPHARRALTVGVPARLPAPSAAATTRPAPAHSDAVESRDRARPHPRQRIARAKPRRPTPGGL